MKKEIEMHVCVDEDKIWSCTQYTSEPDKLYLVVKKDINLLGYLSVEIKKQVSFCPFCGFTTC